MVDLEKHATDFMFHLTEKSHVLWEVAITKAYNADETGAKAIQNTRRKIAQLGLDPHKVRAIGESPGALVLEWAAKAPANQRLLPSQVAGVVRILKDRDLIAQVGSGRGKVTLILQPYAQVNPKNINPNDLVGLIEAVTRNVSGQIEDVNALRDICAGQEKLIADLERKVTDLQHENFQLTSSTWS